MNGQLPTTVELPCLYCGKMHEFPIDSYEARGVFNVFCRGGECEDRYAARGMARASRARTRGRKA